MNKPSIHYHVTPIDLAGHRFEVLLQLAHFEEQELTLQLPNWIGGSYMIRDFAKNIETLSALNLNTVSKQSTRLEPSIPSANLKQIDTNTWSCHITNEGLCIRYIVYAWDLSVRCAHLDETHGFFNPTSLCLRVQNFDHLPHKMTVHSTEKTNHWDVYTSLMPVAETQRHDFGTYLAKNYDELADSPFEMGTPRYLSFEACGALHEMVFTGIMPNTDWDRIQADVKTICEAQIAFFEPQTKKAPFLDSSDRYVFMTMVTGDQYGGLEHRASTALMCSREDLPVIGEDEPSEGYLSFLGLVSHEYFHTWNVKRIKPQAFAPYNLNEISYTKLLWVFEGFTDYFDEVFLYRTDIMSRENYIKSIQKVIQRVYHRSGVYKQSIADSSFNAWNKFYKQDENSPNAIVSYYAKGSLTALCLDAHIQKQSKGQRSLDDVMRLLWDRYGRDFFIKNENKGVQEDEMVTLILEATGIDTSDFIKRYVEGVEELPLKEALAHQGIELSWHTKGSYIGWGTRSNHGQCVLSYVLESSPAHTAGLSAQDVLVAINNIRITDKNLDTVLKRFKAGNKVNVHVFRRDELRVFNLQLGAPVNNQAKLTDIGDTSKKQSFIKGIFQKK